MQKNKTKTDNSSSKLIVVLMVIFSLILLILLISDEDPSTSTVYSTDNNLAQQLTKAGSPVLVNKPYLANTKNYQYCEKLTEDYRKYAYQWAREEQDEWHRYLTEGYTLDDITAAIEYFTNSNFAASFRVKQLRRNAKLTTTNKELRDLLKVELSTINETLPGFTISKKVPHPALDNYPQLSQEQRVKLLGNTTVTVDDIAYFISEPDVSDVHILELLSTVNDPAEIVGYQKHEAISLLDYAALSNRLGLVEELINLGLVPTSDAYLGSTMEWALAALSQARTPAAQESSSQIVMILQAQGATARFTKQEGSKVEGYIPRRSYEFDGKQITELAQNYGLNLMLIESRETLKVDEKSLLISILKEEQSTYLSNKLRVVKLDKKLSTCQETMDTINKQWQPKSLQTTLSNALEEYTASSTDIESTLHKIDPIVVDYYRKNYVGHTRKQRFMSGIDSHLKPLRDGNITQVIDYFSTVQLSDANKNWLFSQILMWDMNYYEQLKNSHLLVDEIEYFDFNTRMLTPDALTKLTNSGATLYDLDSRGKTLLYYAVQKADIGLITFMQDEHYPFSLEPLGQDPLHIALNSTDYKFSVDKVFKIVEILMSYQPNIDEFHLSRMALLKLKYPKLYLQLTDNYTELRIKAETTLPKTELSRMAFFRQKNKG